MAVRLIRMVGYECYQLRGGLYVFSFVIYKIFPVLIIVAPSIAKPSQISQNQTV